MRINQDFIGVVERVENLLNYKKIEIEQKDADLKNILKTMLENDNQSVMDLQSHFTMAYKTTTTCLSYLLPYEYTSSMVPLTCYPKILSFADYQTITTEARIQSKTNAIELYKHNVNDVVNDKRVKDRVESDAKKFGDTLKRDLYQECCRYIDALNYYRAINIIKNQPNVEMFATEICGWNEYKYPVSDDMELTVKTNFGYGSSSYFFVNVKFRGVDILPYSSTVNYYYANMVEFIRYTRLYNPVRDSWNTALHLVVEVSNLAITNIDSFINKWIKNEVTEMIDGLLNIYNAPDETLNRIKNNKPGSLLTVKDINAEEEEKYSVYNSEMIIAFQAEKITNALLLIAKLESLVPIYPEVVDSINQIKQLNCKILPEIELNIRIISTDIVAQTDKLLTLDNQLSTFMTEIKPMNQEIEILYLGSDDQTWRGKNLIKEKYIQDHIEYKKIKDKIDTLEKDIKEKHKDISQRQSFIDRLEKSKSVIRFYVGD